FFDRGASVLNAKFLISVGSRGQELRVQKHTRIIRFSSVLPIRSSLGGADIWCELRIRDTSIRTSNHPIKSGETREYIVHEPRPFPPYTTRASSNAAGTVGQSDCRVERPGNLDQAG